jgi:hypothetical protein
MPHPFSPGNKQVRGQNRQPPDPGRLEPSVRGLVPLLRQHTQEISRSVIDAMDQNGVAPHFVKNQIAVDDENAIAKRREFGNLKNTTN